MWRKNSNQLVQSEKVDLHLQLEFLSAAQILQLTSLLKENQTESCKTSECEHVICTASSCRIKRNSRTRWVQVKTETPLMCQSGLNRWLSARSSPYLNGVLNRDCVMLLFALCLFSDSHFISRKSTLLLSDDAGRSLIWKWNLLQKNTTQSWRMFRRRPTSMFDWTRLFTYWIPNSWFVSRPDELWCSSPALLINRKSC